MAKTVGVKRSGGLAEYLKNTGAAIDDGTVAQAGYFPDATYPDGTHIATIAAIQEFGAPAANIPPRPTMRPLADDMKKTGGADFAKILKAADNNVPLALARMAVRMQSNLQLKVRDLKDPPNAESTIEKKGFDDPLIHSGDMYRAIQGRVGKIP